MSTAILVDDAARVIDALDPPSRVLLTCIYRTAHRAQLAGIVARETADAIFAGLIKDKTGQSAVAEFISFHLTIYMDDVDDIYFAETA